MHPFESDLPDPVSVIDPDGIDCVLAAGEAADLGEIRAWLAQLPEGAYGKVFVEVRDESQVEPLECPPGVSATWLVRPRGGAAPARRGDALVTAVDAWFDEWLWAESGTGRSFQLWMGARTSSVVQSYWLGLDRRLRKRWPGFCDGCERGCSRRRHAGER